MILAFAPPARLLSMNDRDHYRKHAELVKAWREATYFYACQSVPGPRNRRRYAKQVVRVALPVPDKRRRDPHNFFPTIKPIVDGLTDAGLWPDDTPEHVTTPEPVLYQGTEVVVVVEAA